MKQKTVFLMCGPSASGKSTWIQERMNENSDSVWCSRDNVRFSLLGENDEYFAKEYEVFAKWIEEIQTVIDNEAGPQNIYIDATHITRRSRNKTLNKLNLSNVDKIIAVNLLTPLETCLERNHFREGRARVPEEVIVDMYSRFIPAKRKEKNKYFEVINVYVDG